MDEQIAQAGTEGAVEAPVVDNAALLGRMDELAGEIRGLREAPSPEFQGGIREALTPDQDADPALEDDSFEPYQDQSYDPYSQQAQPDQQQALAQLQAYIAEQAGGIADQKVGAVQQQMQQYIQQQEVARLEKQYPDLNKPEVVGPLVVEAQNFARQLGRPELATSPAMIEKLYLAQQASARAAQETPADGDQEVHLEGGGAGQQGSSSPEDDLVSRVVNAGGADASGRAFWGA